MAICFPDKSVWCEINRNYAFRGQTDLTPPYVRTPLYILQMVRVSLNNVSLFILRILHILLVLILKKKRLGCLTCISTNRIRNSSSFMILRQDGAMRTNGTSDRHQSLSICQPVQLLSGSVSGHRAATTCGNGVESFNVASQSSVSIVN